MYALDLGGLYYEYKREDIDTQMNAAPMGYVFIASDFDFCKKQSINTALCGLQKEGKIRRVMRGMYDIPKYSKLVKEFIPPDIDQIARAMARKNH